MPNAYAFGILIIGSFIIGSAIFVSNLESKSSQYATSLCLPYAKLGITDKYVICASPNGNIVKDLK